MLDQRKACITFLRANLQLIEILYTVLYDQFTFTMPWQKFNTLTGFFKVYDLN